MFGSHEHAHCIEDAVSAAVQICEERGLRFTDLRRHVLELVWEGHGAVKAYDLLEKLDAEYSAKPPTVYRALEFLQENGLVHKINSLNAYVGCSHPLAHKDCFFLICSECNEVQECCSENLSDSLKSLVKKSDFLPEQTTLEIEGKCKECQAAH